MERGNVTFPPTSYFGSLRKFPFKISQGFKINFEENTDKGLSVNVVILQAA